MKPSFALTISPDAVGLLHRVPSGWLSLGTVRFDDPDLDAAVARLRAAALELAPDGLATKLVIPNSEILFDSVTAPGPKAAERRAQIGVALEGRTPYKLDELVFDWSGTGEEVQVAVVARETLTEAEAFAVQHGLNPVSFVAIPEPGGFAAEPWFGTTASVGDVLPKGERVVRDQDPIRIITRGAAAARALAAASEPAAAEPAGEPADEPTEDLPEVIAAEPAEAETAAPAPVEAPPEPVETYAIPDPFWRQPEQVAAPEPEPEPAAEPEPTPDPVAEPEPEVLAEAEPAIVPDPLAQAEPAAGVAAETAEADDGLTLDWSQSTEDRLDSAKVALAASLAPAPDPAQAALVAGLRPDSALDNDIPPMPGSLRAPPSRAAVSPAAPATPGVALSEKLGQMMVKKVKGKPRKPAERPALAAPPPLPISASQPRVPQPATEAEAMTVFGERQQRVGGKPRYLGIVLTGALLMVLILVAVWAANFVEPPGRSEAPAQETGTAPRQQASAPPPAEVDTAERAAAPADPVLVIDEGELLPETGAAPDDTAETAAPRTAEPPATVEAAPASAAAGRDSAPASTDRALAHGPVDELTLPLPDPTLGAAPEARLAAVSGSNADLAPGGSPVLQEFGALYQFDAEGNIIPTADGVITPDGVRLVAGRPTVVPPRRPADAEAATPAAVPSPVEAAPPAAPPAPALAATDPGPGSVVILPVPGTAPAIVPGSDAGATSGVATFSPDSAAPATRPRLRPQDATPAANPAPEPPAATTTDDEGALPATIAPADAETVSPSLAARRPLARPATIAAAADAARARQLAEAAATAAAAASTAVTPATTIAALAPTRRPAARPANFSRQVETAVAAAVAQPRSAPATAATPAVARRTAPEPDDDGEPEVTRAAPNIPTRASVARQATVSGALSLGRINLIGVFGPANNRYALVRESGGRMIQVKVGDRLDGGRVTAIGQSDLSYARGNNTQRLQMPRG